MNRFPLKFTPLQSSAIHDEDEINKDLILCKEIILRSKILFMDPTPEQGLNQPEMMVRNDANWIKLRDYEPIHLIRDYEEKQTAGDESTPLLS